MVLLVGKLCQFFFWLFLVIKVRLNDCDGCRLNEEMIETLFVVNAPNSKPKETTPRSVLPMPNTENRVLDPKKSQNIAISLRALNVTVEEVCEALLEGICPVFKASL